MSKIFDEIIRPKANELLSRAKLPADQVKSENHKNIFLKDLASFTYQNNNGAIVASDEQGFEVTDPHGYTLPIDQFIKLKFDKYFEVSDLPISEAECIARLKDPKINPTERKRITDHWDKLKGK